MRTKSWIATSMALIYAVLAIGPLHAQNLASRDRVGGAEASVRPGGQLANLLRPPLPGGATAQAPATVYNPDSLYQYIDGGADLYLLYDFKALLHQDFKSGASELTADIYQMSKPEDAFGIYASERSPSYQFTAIAAEGYRDKGILNFFKGLYYVKLSGSGANVSALLEQFAQLLSSRIGGARTLPLLLGKLPRQNRIPHSEQYVKKDPLGHAFLAPAYVVTYAQGKQESKLLVSVANNPQDATERVGKLAKHFKQSGESSSAPELGEDGIRANNSFEGHVIARRCDRYLIALFNPGDNGPAILMATAQGLRSEKSRPVQGEP